MIIIRHKSSSAMIYIESPMELTFFQIDMLESFFQRMMFYCEDETHIDINIQHLTNGDFYAVGYFYNKNQNYDYCGTFENAYIAIHHVLSDFFNLSIGNNYLLASINNRPNDNDEDYHKDDNEDISEIGKVVNEMLKDSELDPED